MTYSKDDNNKEVETVPKKVYIIIDNKKHYIESEIVKKYNLEEEKITCMTGHKLYFEKK